MLARACNSKCVHDTYVSSLSDAQTMTTAFSETLRVPQPCALGTGAVHASTLDTERSSATANLLHLTMQTTPVVTARMWPAPSRAARRSMTPRATRSRVACAACTARRPLRCAQASWRVSRACAAAWCWGTGVQDTRYRVQGVQARRHLEPSGWDGLRVAVEGERRETREPRAQPGHRRGSTVLYYIKVQGVV